MAGTSGTRSRWRTTIRKIKGGGPLPLLRAVKRTLGDRPPFRLETTSRLRLVEGMTDGELPLQMQLSIRSTKPAAGMFLHLVPTPNPDQTLPLNVLKNSDKLQPNLLPLILNNLVNINKPLNDKNRWRISRPRSGQRVRGGMITLRHLRPFQRLVRMSILVLLLSLKPRRSRAGEERDRIEPFRSRILTKLRRPSGALLLLTIHRIRAEDGVLLCRNRMRCRLLVRSA